MIISIATPQFDPEGWMTINPLPSTDLGSITRRVNRSQTLDGGAVVNDTGYWAQDRTFRIRWRIRGKEELDQIRRLVQTYPQLIVSTQEGCFTAAPAQIKNEDGVADLTLLVMDERS